MQSKLQTRVAHFMHRTLPQYPQISQNCLAGALNVDGAARAAVYERGGADKRASITSADGTGGI